MFAAAGRLLVGADTARNEQERRDSELAFRLAQESNFPAYCSNSSGFSLSISNVVEALKAGKKPNFDGWKDADLRDTINTSCDVTLVEACHKECHRRLKVYDAWKSKSKGRAGLAERAPNSVYQPMQNNSFAPSAPPLLPTPDVEQQQQRYFRVPFTKDVQNKGWWYVHFDGENIEREMEIYAGRIPALYVSGRDDVNMCRLKLQETGLTRRPGTHILELEFEKEWAKNGGVRYIRPTHRQNLM